MQTDRELLELAAKAAGVVRERHGMNKSPEHRAWVHMKQRCTNQKKREWHCYGGRGIKVCQEWMHSFVAFFSCVGPKPSKFHSLDRIDVNGDYEPGNVRWATQQQQIENTRTARMVTIDGKTQTIAAWEREKGLSQGQVRSREVAGWSLLDAITIPSIKGQKRVMKVKRDYATYQRDWHGRYAGEKSSDIGRSMQDGKS